MITRFFLAVCTARELSRSGYGLRFAAEQAAFEFGGDPRQIADLAAEAELRCAYARSQLLQAKVKRLGAAQNESEGEDDV